MRASSAGGTVVFFASLFSRGAVVAARPPFGWFLSAVALAREPGETPGAPEAWAAAFPGFPLLAGLPG